MAVNDFFNVKLTENGAVPVDLDGSSVDSIPSGADTFVSGRKAVTVANTSEVLGGNVPCREIIIQALSTNAQPLRIGGTGLVATVGSETGTLLFPGDIAILSISNLNKVFVNSPIIGEGVSYSYTN